MNRNRWILIFVAFLAFLSLLLLAVLFLTWPSQTVVAPPPVAPTQTAPPARPVVKQKAVVKSAPSLPQTIINIYNDGCCQVPSAPQPAPMSTPTSPAPAPAVQPPAASSCSEADNYYCGTPPAPAPVGTPIASAQSPRPINVLSGNTFQLNILSGNGSGNGGTRYGYGSTYGWTPGHEMVVCEPAPRGCYRKWIAHPQPGY